MRKEFVPLTARVIRRKPWARGKKSRTARKEMKPVRVELRDDVLTSLRHNEGDPLTPIGGSRIVSGVMNEAKGARKTEETLGKPRDEPASNAGGMDGEPASNAGTNDKVTTKKGDEDGETGEADVLQ